MRKNYHLLKTRLNSAKMLSPTEQQNCKGGIRFYNVEKMKEMEWERVKQQAERAGLEVMEYADHIYCIDW